MSTRTEPTVDIDTVEKKINAYLRVDQDSRDDSKRYVVAFKVGKHGAE